MFEKHIIKEVELQAPQQSRQAVTLDDATIRAIVVTLADELERRGAVRPQHEFYRRAS